MSESADLADAFTDLVLTLFRANNEMLVWGDRLVQPFGLTSARWQIMGAVAYADQPRPVAWLARDLGANRQNVQRIVNDLSEEGMVAFEANPNHKRAHLVVLTEKGRTAYDSAVRAWYTATADLAKGLSADDMKTALSVMKTMRSRLVDNATLECRHGDKSF